MSESTQNSLVPIGDDGFEAAAAEGAERILKGDLLKFSDGHWLVGREAVLIKQDLRLVAMGTAAAWVRWAGGKPDKYVIRQAGAPFPEREELGDNDEALWEPGPDDKPRDPWQSTPRRGAAAAPSSISPMPSFATGTRDRGLAPW